MLYLQHLQGLHGWQRLHSGEIIHDIQRKYQSRALQDGPDIICPSCAKTKMEQEYENEIEV